MPTTDPIGTSTPPKATPEAPAVTPPSPQPTPSQTIAPKPTTTQPNPSPSTPTPVPISPAPLPPPIPSPPKAPLNPPVSTTNNPELPTLLTKRQAMKPIILIVSMIVIGLLIGLVIAVLRRSESVSVPLNEEINAPFPEFDSESDPADTSVVPDVDCDNFPQNLAGCTEYSCQFNHPLTNEVMTRTINGFSEGDVCEYVETMPNNGKMNCNYSPEMRAVIAQYYSDLTDVDSFGASLSSNGETTAIEYTVNGLKVTNPLQAALDNGECIVSGN